MRGRDAGGGARLLADFFFVATELRYALVAGPLTPLLAEMRGRACADSFAATAADRYNDTDRGTATDRSHSAADRPIRHGNQTVHPSPQANLGSVETDPFGPGDLGRYRESTLANQSVLTVYVAVAGLKRYRIWWLRCIRTSRGRNL